MDRDIESAAKDLGISVDDYIFLHTDPEEAEEKTESDVSSDIKVPFFTNRTQKKRLQKAIRGISLNDPSITRSSEPLMEFFVDLAAVLSRSRGALIDSVVPPSPFDSAPQRRDVIMTVDTAGLSAWKYRSGTAYVFGVTGLDKDNAYGIPPTATLTFVQFSREKGPQLKYFMSSAKGVLLSVRDDTDGTQLSMATKALKRVRFSDANEHIESEISLFGKKKKTSTKTGAERVKPFRLTFTGLPGEGGNSRLFVLPPEIAEGGVRSFSVLFPLSESRSVGGFLNANTIRAAQGAMVMDFGTEGVASVAILSLPPSFAPETSVSRSGSETPVLSGARGSALPARDTAMSMTMARMRTQEKAFAAVLDAVGNDKVEQWEAGPVSYLAQKLVEVQVAPELQGITRRGSILVRISQLGLLSITIRSGLMHMIENTERHGAATQPRESLAVASALMQTAVMLRWTIFALFQKNVYVDARANWMRGRGIQSLTIQSIANFPAEYFTSDFAKLVENAEKRDEVDTFVDPLRGFHTALLDVVGQAGTELSSNPSGPVVFGLLLRNYLLSDFSAAIFERAHKWPEQFEALVFVLLAAGAALAKRAGLSDADIGMATQKVVKAEVDTSVLPEIHATLVRAFATEPKIPEKPRNGRRTRRTITRAGSAID